MYMKLKDGKSKVLTLSYDDAVVQDIRLIDIMNRHGLKGTFNVNSGLYLAEDAQRDRFYGRLKRSEAQKLYVPAGQEVAIHSYSHPVLTKLSTCEIIEEIIKDRASVERDFGTLARGMAYPFGPYNNDVLDILAKCKICYSRTVNATRGFEFPNDWLQLHPTCHHNEPKLMELAKTFVETDPPRAWDNWMFYLWGHSYEFDLADNWSRIETFAAYVGGKDDVWYATNIEIYDYVKAYESLQVSVDKTLVYNPSAIDVWFLEGEQVYCVKAGETVRL